MCAGCCSINWFRLVESNVGRQPTAACTELSCHGVAEVVRAVPRGEARGAVPNPPSSWVAPTLGSGRSDQQHAGWWVVSLSKRVPKFVPKFPVTPVSVTFAKVIAAIGQLAVGMLWRW